MELLNGYSKISQEAMTVVQMGDFTSNFLTWERWKGDLFESDYLKGKMNRMWW